MKKSHILEEIKLISDMQVAKAKLYIFYKNVRHMSKKNAAKKAFGLSEAMWDKNLILLGQEKAFVKMLNKYEGNIH